MGKTMGIVLDKIDEIVGSANLKLAEIVKGGYPYTLTEVQITYEDTPNAIFVYSGETTVASVPLKGNPYKAVDKIRYAVNDVVYRTKDAVDRRSGLKEDADSIASESELHDKAVPVLQAAGLDPIATLGGLDQEAIEKVVTAAKDAVAEANKNPPLGFINLRDFKMQVKCFSCGIVIEAGGKPCLVSRFPRVATPEKVDGMIVFLNNNIKGISDSRRRYFDFVQKEIEKEERLRSLADKAKAIDEEMMAM